MCSRIKLVLALASILFTSSIAYAQVGPAPGIQLQDEGVSQGRIQILNCVGAGVACTKSGVTGTATIAGGAGASWTVTEINFGVDAKFVAKATVTDAAITATTKIMVLQSGIAATGRQADENEMDSITCSAIPGTGDFVLQCACQRSVTHGLFKVNYTTG